MPNLYCIRAESGKYAERFVNGGYAGIGWLPNDDLSAVKTREELYPLYQKESPDDSNLVVGQQVGQIARFLLEIEPGDHVLTPDSDTEWLHVGVMQAGYSYVPEPKDGCHYRHRRPVKWLKRVRRADFSIPFQASIKSSLTVFAVPQRDHFFQTLAMPDGAGAGNAAKPAAKATAYDPQRAVLERLLELDPKEFEVLVTHLLSALGFEGTEHTGKSGDGGVDATGELNLANLAKVKLFVQVKRYKLDARIDAKTVKALRASIPANGQGAFITTADFQEKAVATATEPGFPRIGLINGGQLVDLLVEHWADIPAEFQTKLALKQGLILA